MRTQIRESLENNYFRSQNQPFAAHIAFQIAFCYHIGFGVKSDANECHRWLERSTKQPDDLNAEKEVVQPDSFENGIKRELIRPIGENLIHIYRQLGLENLKEILKSYEREVGDMEQEFGELHIIPLALYSIMGDLLDELGELEKSKALWMRIRHQIEKIYGIGHPYQIQSIINVVKSHKMLGEWVEAPLLQEETLKYMESTQGMRSLVAPSIMVNLA